MDMYKLKWTRLQSEIFRLFCIKAGQRINLRGVARCLNVSPTAVANALPELVREGALRVDKSKTINLLSIEFNRDNHRAVDLKRVENLKMIYESGLAEMLFNEYPGSTVILFGSYSRGEDWAGDEENISDIDIAIIGAASKDIKLNNISKMLERKIAINHYDSWEGIHRNLRNNILNGILLKGCVDL